MGLPDTLLSLMKITPDISCPIESISSKLVFFETRETHIADVIFHPHSQKEAGNTSAIAPKKLFAKVWVAFGQSAFFASKLIHITFNSNSEVRIFPKKCQHYALRVYSANLTLGKLSELNFRLKSLTFTPNADCSTKKFWLVFSPGSPVSSHECNLMLSKHTTSQQTTASQKGSTRSSWRVYGLTFNSTSRRFSSCVYVCLTSLKKMYRRGFRNGTGVVNWHTNSLLKKSLEERLVILRKYFSNRGNILVLVRLNGEVSGPTWGFGDRWWGWEPLRLGPGWA